MKPKQNVFKYFSTDAHLRRAEYYATNVLLGLCLFVFLLDKKKKMKRPKLGQISMKINVIPRNVHGSLRQRSAVVPQESKPDSLKIFTEAFGLVAHTTSSTATSLETTEFNLIPQRSFTFPSAEIDGIRLLLVG